MDECTNWFTSDFRQLPTLSANAKYPMEFPLLNSTNFFYWKVIDVGSNGLWPKRFFNFYEKKIQEFNTTHNQSIHQSHLFNIARFRVSNFNPHQEKSFWIWIPSKGHGLFQLKPINLEHLTDIRICSICLAYTGRVRNRILQIYKYEAKPPA